MSELDDVLQAAKKRIALVFDEFQRVIVSVSGGKDSHVLWCLAVSEAERRGRKVETFFLDQEAEYAGSIEVIESMMVHPSVEPRWFQVPIRMTNATSHSEEWLHAWAPGEPWMREPSALALREAKDAPDRFYEFFPWYERCHQGAAFLVGLRSRESLNRWRATKANPGFRGIGWSTKAEGDGNYRFYPVFDWRTGDIWKYLADHGVRYNRVYDRMFALRGADERRMRVSFLAHEQSFRGLTMLQELEPATYERLIQRLGGVHCAALYADEEIFRALKLPDAFATWIAYREHIMATTPTIHAERLRKRFDKQGNDEATCREHVRQLLTNDWENNVPIRRVSAEKLRKLWFDRL